MWISDTQEKAYDSAEEWMFCKLINRVDRYWDTERKTFNWCILAHLFSHLRVQIALIFM